MHRRSIRERDDNGFHHLPIVITLVPASQTDTIVTRRTFPSLHTPGSNIERRRTAPGCCGSQPHELSEPASGFEWNMPPRSSLT